VASVTKVSKDPATFIGIFGAYAVLIAAVITGGGIEGLDSLLHVPSFLVTIGGSFFSTFTAFSVDQVLMTGSAVKRGMTRRKFDPVGTVQILVALGKLARREGLLALENLMKDVDDALIQHGIQLTVDGLSGEEVEIVLRSEMEAYLDRQEDGREILAFLAMAAPAFGMIGTLIGLVLMLGNLEDPNSIGSGMATALITTLYGAIAANTVFTPLAKKLENRSREEAFQGEICIQGCAMIASGIDYRMMQDKLLSQLSDHSRGRFEETDTKQAA
jgi:chemotaxis protein MotA